MFAELRSPPTPLCRHASTLWWCHWMQQHSDPRTSFIAYDAVGTGCIKHTIYQWRECWLPYVRTLYTIPYDITYMNLRRYKIHITMLERPKISPSHLLKSFRISQVTWLPIHLASIKKTVKWVGWNISSDLGFKIGDGKREQLLNSGSIHSIRIYSQCDIMSSYSRNT